MSKGYPLKDNKRIRDQRNDQFANKKARQWILLLLLTSQSENTFHETACSYETCLPIVDTHIPDGKQANPCNSDNRHVFYIRSITNKQTAKWRIFFTCCISLAKSGQRALRPDSSKIFSNVMPCNATSVVSNMSRPAWFANMNTGCGCNAIKPRG